MMQADLIRKFALDQYVTPARAAGRAEIIVRAGDVHKAMGLTSAMPAVCSAIGSNKFNALAQVSPISRDGPANGANVYFKFSLTADLSLKELMTAHVKPAPAPAQSSDALDLKGAIVLVSCVKSKLPYPAPARCLYTSAWFRKTRQIVEASGARWFVLSSLYGLVEPDAEIAPYDYTLNTLGVAERQEWAKKVLAELLPVIAGARRVVMFAGHRYNEFLLEPIRRHGISVEIPMAHLKRGEQLNWLSEAE
jgi:hypothetical protein